MEKNRSNTLLQDFLDQSAKAAIRQRASQEFWPAAAMKNGIANVIGDFVILRNDSKIIQ